jgi:hypothetical protein
MKNSLQDNTTKMRQVQGLLCLFGCGIIGAVILTFLLLYLYNPSGSYSAQYLLPDPKNLSRTHFSYIDPNTGSVLTVQFEDIRFSHYLPEEKRWEERSIDLHTYAQFYARIQGDQNVSPVSEEVRQAFEQRHLSALAVIVKLKDGGIRTYSLVQFSESLPYYRIGQAKEGWVYFTHPDQYQTLNDLFIRP